MFSISSSEEAGKRSGRTVQQVRCSAPAPSDPEKNFGLSRADFEHLNQQVRRGKEYLYEQVFLAHFGDCMRYLKLQCKASHNDAYDATMEAMVLFLERLKAGKVRYGNLRFLFTRMALQIYFRWIKKMNAPLVYSPLEIGAEPDRQAEWLPLLERVWPRLSVQDRNLLSAFYFQGRSLKELAAEAGTTAATLRKRKQRSLERLRRLFLNGL